jgi:hypothetical protein
MQDWYGMVLTNIILDTGKGQYQLTDKEMLAQVYMTILDESAQNRFLRSAFLEGPLDMTKFEQKFYRMPEIATSVFKERLSSDGSRPSRSAASPSSGFRLNSSSSPYSPNFYSSPSPTPINTGPVPQLPRPAPRHSQPTSSAPVFYGKPMNRPNQELHPKQFDPERKGAKPHGKS